MLDRSICQIDLSPITSSPLAFPFGHEAFDALDPTYEEHAPLVVLPDQHADLVGVLARRLVLRLGLEVFEQEPRCRGHAVALELPEVDLVDYGCGEDAGGDGAW